jgi:hypothetical protein
MSANRRDARELVRSFIKGRVPERNIGKIVAHCGEQIRISKEDGAIRFDLIGMQKAFVLKSNRLYVSDFKAPKPASDTIETRGRARPGTIRRPGNSHGVHTIHTPQKSEQSMFFP